MNDPNIDRLRSGLGAAADELELDPIDAPSILARAAVRRRRRHVALGGGFAVLAVALVGGVVANRDRGDDTIEFAETTPTTSPDTTADTTADTGPDTTTPITTPPTLAPSEAADTVPIVGSATSAPDADVMNLLPWHDGFLHLGYRYVPQPLDALPEEISALFPDEVLALFPDGLPPTIDEATAVLTEAGLLDEVTAVLAEHPEASEAIYATDAPPPELEAAYTTDAVSWSALDVTVPFDFPTAFGVSGHRLFTWSFGDWTVEPSGAPREFVIAWTDDLTTWDTSTLPLAPGDTAPHVQRDVFVNGLSVVGDRWVALVDRRTWVDYVALLPDDLQEELRFSEFGYGTSVGPDGVTIEVFSSTGESTSLEFTWAELGLDGNPETFEGAPDGSVESTLLVGTFGGAAEEVPLPGGVDYGATFAGRDEFFLLSDVVLSSRDGLSWTPVTGLPTDRYFTNMTTIGDGELFIAQDTSADAWYRAGDGSVTQVDLPDLGSPYSLWNDASGSGAWIIDVSQGSGDTLPEPIMLTVTVEHDGFVVTLTDGPDGSDYTVADGNTDDILAAGHVGPGEDSRSEFIEVDETTGEYAGVFRDADGNEIVRIPGDVLDEAYRAAYDTAAGSATEPGAEWTPDLWLIATGNGTDWLTIDLDDPSASGYWPGTPAVNDGRLLYRASDGWTLVDLPTAD